MSKRRLQALAILLFVLLPSLTIYRAQDYIGSWDWSGSAEEEVRLGLVEYAVGMLGADLNIGDPPISTHRVELSTDWITMLRDAGISEELIASLSEHYRADVLDGWLAALEPDSYSFWARVIKDNGIPSSWAESIDVISIPEPPIEPPSPPLNLRCAPCGK
jgi:hypothetical protein